MASPVVPIEGFPSYEISADGTVLSIKKNGDRVPLRANGNAKGYLRVTLRRDMKKYDRYVHRLVAQHFLPIPEGKRLSDLVVRHLNGNPSDNHVDNLAFGDAKDNARDRSLHQKMNQRKTDRHKKIKRLEDENARLRRLLVDHVLEIDALKAALKGAGQE